jgi:hypothetical protein
MQTRQFIPAYFHDNYVMQAVDPFYLDRVIQALPGTGGKRDSAKGRQLAEGDWDINDGMMFADDWHAHKVVHRDDVELLSLGFVEGQIIPWHVVPMRQGRAWLPPASAKIYGSVDYGYGAPFSFHLHAVLPGNHVRTFFEIYKAGLRDVHQAKAIRAAIERFMDQGVQKPRWIVYDPQMDGDRGEQNIVQTIADVYQEHLGQPLQIKLTPGGGGKGARLGRIQVVKDALAPMVDGFPHWTITENCTELIRTLPDLPTDLDDPEYIDEDAEDHAYEDCGRFFQTRPAPPRPEIPTEFDVLDPLSRAEQLGKARRHGELPKTPGQPFDPRRLT